MYALHLGLHLQLHCAGTYSIRIDLLGPYPEKAKTPQMKRAFFHITRQLIYSGALRFHASFPEFPLLLDWVFDCGL